MRTILRSTFAALAVLLAFTAVPAANSLIIAIDKGQVRSSGGVSIQRKISGTIDYNARVGQRYRVSTNEQRIVVLVADRGVGGQLVIPDSADVMYKGQTGNDILIEQYGDRDISSGNAVLGARSNFGMDASANIDDCVAVVPRNIELLGK